MHMRSTLLCTLTLALGIPAHAARHQDLDSWVARELTPFVVSQLSSHPRFRGETVRFVVMYDGNPQPATNELALSLRDRLQRAAADLPGVRVGWRPDQPEFGRNAGDSTIDCTRESVHYYIGIEVRELHDRQFSVSVRALDLEDRTWVAGFSRSWKGALTPSQRAAVRRLEDDESFRGERDVPFEPHQTDLLAARLAYELGCTLLRQLEGEYVVTAGDGEDEDDDDIVELIGNNLAEYRALQFAAGGDQANAVIEGKAHRVDDDLYQYWISVRPTADRSDLPALSASAYIYLPEVRIASSTDLAPGYLQLQSDSDILTSLRLVQLEGVAACTPRSGSRHTVAYDPRFRRRECPALQVRAADDAVVFFLHHQLNNGLVRLADGNCRGRPDARIARTGHVLNFSLPDDALSSATTRAGDQWQLAPDTDIYYALAASDSKAARALAQHLDRLPKRCSQAVRPGLEGDALRTWLEDLQTLVEYFKPHVDWRTVRVSNVF